MRRVHDLAKRLNVAGWLFVVGIVLFSGSLYLLAIKGHPALGSITPFGGVAFLAGWACLAVDVARSGRGQEAPCR